MTWNCCRSFQKTRTINWKHDAQTTWCRVSLQYMYMVAHCYVHAVCTAHTQHTHSRPKCILTNTLNAVIGRWRLLIIPYSWFSWLDFNAVHVNERSKELPHVVHNACRLCTMYRLGGIPITWTTFANRGRCEAKFIELFIDVRCWLIVDSWRFCCKRSSKHIQINRPPNHEVI